MARRAGLSSKAHCSAVLLEFKAVDDLQSTGFSVTEWADIRVK